MIVDGALDESATFTDYALLDEYLDRVKADARGDGIVAEVYILWHEHSQDIGDCACAQYVTDHHPAYTFGPVSA